MIQGQDGLKDSLFVVSEWEIVTVAKSEVLVSISHFTELFTNTVPISITPMFRQHAPPPDPFSIARQQAGDGGFTFFFPFFQLIVNRIFRFSRQFPYWRLFFRATPARAILRKYRLLQSLSEGCFVGLGYLFSVIGNVSKSSTDI